ncbi:glycosyltransferase, partial [Alkalihalophilus lindianensis]
MSINLPKLTIVVPCYNEEATLEETTKELTRVMKNLIADKKINNDSTILYVDDGSSDRTWEIIEEKIASNLFIQGIKLSRNF